MTEIAVTPRRLGAEALAAPAAAGALYAALVALAAAPVWLWPIPRATDIVNHWARLTLYRDPLAQLYRVHFGIIPNLGVDALYLALAPWLSPESVARLALALAIALPALGAWAVHRALFKQPSPTIWLVPFLSYNVATSAGLVNFALGMGLAFLALAYVLARRQRLGWLDLVALNLIGAALFFCHLFAWAAFAGLLGLLCLGSPLPWRARTRRLGFVLASQLVPLALVALREAAPAGYAMGDRSPFGFAEAPVAAMTGASDLVAAGCLIAVVVVAVARGARLAPRAWLAVVGFILAAWLAPASHGAATLIDARLKVYVWYFAIAATSLPATEGVRVFAAALAVALTAARLASVAPAWEALQDRAAEVRAALSVLPQGARALVVAPAGCRDPSLTWTTALLPFAVIDRRAYVNTLFAQSGIQPVAPADPALDGGPTLPMDARWLTPAGRAELPAHLASATWARPYIEWRRHFTHLIDERGACASTLDAAGLTKLGGGGGIDVYRID
jgi:hypothetical protein